MGQLTIRAVNAQVSEMQLVREKVYAMEQTHMTLKQKLVLPIPPSPLNRILTFKSLQV